MTRQSKEILFERWGNLIFSAKSLGSLLQEEEYS
jgi:hypothetical protein